MKLGLVVYATDTGLGVQSRAAYHHLKPAKTMLVDLSFHNHMPLHLDWYDYDIKTTGYPSNPEIDRFLEGLDVVFVCETPLNYFLFERARQLGIKTVQQPNPEFLDYFTRRTLTRPDVLALPSSWMESEVHTVAGGASVQSLPVPIDLESLPQRAITSARHFFHIAGRPAVHDRNGTMDFIAAVTYAAPRMPEATFTIYCQQPTPAIEQAITYLPIQLVGHVDDQADIYRDGDVLVLPRRYGGLCLPAQEAIGCGIPVLMPNISPNNTRLPAHWLTAVKPQVQQFVTRSAIRVHSVNPLALANQLVMLYQQPEAVRAMHLEALQLAQEMSWEALLPRYEEVLSPIRSTV